MKSLFTMAVALQSILLFLDDETKKTVQPYVDTLEEGLQEWGDIIERGATDGSKRIP